MSANNARRNLSRFGLSGRISFRGGNDPHGGAGRKSLVHFGRSVFKPVGRTETESKRKRLVKHNVIFEAAFDLGNRLGVRVPVGEKQVGKMTLAALLSLSAS